MGRRAITASAAETEAVGAAIARELEEGDVVVLSGEVGAGKTTLIRGACRQLGVKEPVTSPTFTIGHRYQGRLSVSHLDLYRLQDLEDEDPGLLEDYVEAGAVTFVEWPVVAERKLRSAKTLEINLSHAGGDRRMIEVVAASHSK
ncbi:MAG: tRNA (adenosine(37)-N6)-threonylcarbamoyltransferase complex ATPase subunit type 1 TsaE [Solirubrobacterales bacterium]